MFGVLLGEDIREGKSVLPDGTQLTAVSSSIIATPCRNIGTEIPSRSTKHCAFVEIVVTNGWLVTVQDLVCVVVKGSNAREWWPASALLKER